MKATRKTAILVGALFIVTTFTYSIGDGILQELFKASNFPLRISEHTNLVVMAALLQLSCGVGVVAIAVLMYPIFKKSDEKIAIWYVGIRIVECAVIAVSVVRILALKEVGEYQIAELDILKALGAAAIANYQGSFIVLALVLAFGALAFYYGLFKNSLLPKFIPIWGAVAVVLMVIGLIMEALGFPRLIVLYLPMGLNELFLGFWLLFRGFRQKSPV